MQSNPLTIGRNSILKEILVPNHNQSSHFEVRVQANKNFGICDIVLKPGLRRLNEFLNEFQGRQINDINTIQHLINVLEENLNKA